MNAHDMLPSDSEPRDLEPDTCTCASCSRSTPIDRPSTLTPFSITGPGEYRTRDGRKAIVIEIYDDRAFGRYQTRTSQNGDEWWSFDWGLNGRKYSNPSTRDLVSKWEEPRKPVEGWVNITDSNAIGSYIYLSKWEAERSRAPCAKTVKVRECPDT